MYEVAFYDFIDNLLPEQQTWINSSANWLVKKQIGTYLKSNANGFLFSEEAKAFAELAIDGLMSYNSGNYPGMDDGYPFKWWNSNDFIINSGNFDIDDQQPNAKELALYALSPDEAILHIENSLSALDKAEELVANGTLTGIGDGKADAFRHAFWNALGTAEFGSVLMKLFADAHEWGESGLSVDMDFYNNHKGRIIGQNYNDFTSDIIISNAVLQAVSNGTLRYINNSGQLVATNL